MKLYHFTSAAHLRGIHQHGLTVGDVITDVRSLDGKIAVWLTDSVTPDGMGLEGSIVDKKQFRLSVEVSEVGNLWKWSEWAQYHVTAETQEILKQGSAWESWYLYFGWLRRESIKEVVSMDTGLPVASWGELRTETRSVRGVPYRERRAWQARTMTAVAHAMGLIGGSGTPTHH